MRQPRQTLRGALRLGAVLALAGGILTAAPAAHAEPATRVYLNGTPMPVFFNDGDSFRVLGGKLEGTKARLSGYNTLESYGPVHQWGTWTAKEMYVLAKLATLEARRGEWHCTSDMKTDTYGRMLVWCPKLAEHLCREGLAHAMTVTTDAADPALLKAQQEAILAGRGIWAHGVPDFVLTSLHSIEEDVEGKGTYNRLVSTMDGHSRKWRHENRYEECAKVCNVGVDSDARIKAAVAALRADTTLTEHLDGIDDENLEWIVRKHLQGDPTDKHWKDTGSAPFVGSAIEALREKGVVGHTPVGPPACVVHVDFKRRFGGAKATCLK